MNPLRGFGLGDLPDALVFVVKFAPLALILLGLAALS